MSLGLMLAASILESLPLMLIVLNIPPGPFPPYQLSLFPMMSGVKSRRILLPGNIVTRTRFPRLFPPPTHTRLNWNGDLLIAAATIGDVLAPPTWNIWICGPLDLSFPTDASPTEPRELRQVYDDLNWARGESSPVAYSVRNIPVPSGRLLNFHARDGAPFYSIDSPVLPKFLVS